MVTIYLTNNSAEQSAFSSETALSNTPALQALFLCVVTHISISFDFSSILLTAFTFQNAFSSSQFKLMTKSRERKPARKTNHGDLGEASNVTMGEK